MKRADHGSAGAARDLKLREHGRREGRKLSEKEKQYIYCQTAFLNNKGGYYIHEISTTWLSKQDQNKDDTNGHAKMDGRHFIGQL